MADTWQTIEQAAVTLGLSVRTVNRHITNGKLQSRLFEGRREVLVNSQAELLSDKPKESSVNSPPPAASTAQPNDDSQRGTTSSEFQSYSATQSPDGARQRVTATEVGSDRPLDLQQTMLALADSIDDKSSLAVAAYQTLARSAETQVQSLRRVAFGAWAVVGLLAGGAIIGIGWGALKLTKAEMTTEGLKDQLDKQGTDLKAVAADRDAARRALDAMKEQQTTDLRSQVELLAEQNRREAERAAFVIRQQAELVRAATQPTIQPPSTATTLPSTNPTISSPTTAPATQPISVSPTRPTNFANPKPLVPGQPTDVPDRR